MVTFLTRFKVNRITIEKLWGLRRCTYISLVFPAMVTVFSQGHKLVVNFWIQLKVRDIASARPVARPIIVRFWYFLLIIFLLFLRWRQPLVSKMLPAACHRVLEEVSEETPHRHTRERHRAHHAQIDRGRLRAFVTAVVLDHFPQCRERSHLTFRKVVVYRVSPVPAVKEKAVLEVVEVAQRLFYWALLNFTCACAMQIRWSTPSLPSRKLYAV